MQFKGVKRIVNTLRRRISSISIRGHRHNESAHDAHLSPLFDVVSGEQPQPLTIPASPRSDPSIDTIAREISGLDNHINDSDVSDSSSHSRSSSAAPTSSAASSYEGNPETTRARHILYAAGSSSSPEQATATLPAAEKSVKHDRHSAKLSACLPPPESLTAPIENFVLPSSHLTRNLSFLSLESLTAPLETLVLHDVELATKHSRRKELSPCDIPLPEDEDTEVLELEPWNVPLPFEDQSEDEDGDTKLPSPPHSPLLVTIVPLLEPRIQPASTESPLPPDLDYLCVASAEQADTKSRPTSDSPRVVPMDPLGVSPAVSSSPVDEEGVPEDRFNSTLDSQLSDSLGLPRELPLVTPPAPVGEPEVPDPFIQSSDDDVSEDSFAHISETAQEISLAPQPILPTARSPDVPSIKSPVALSSDDEDEEEVPELYLPGLTLPAMFLPIPNTDPLSTLMTKYISLEKRPPRDLTGDYARFSGEIHPMVMTNSWRAIARQARDRIVEADPEDVPFILSLWYIRLSSLARMRLFNQCSAECTNLFAVLHGVEPADTRAFLFDRILPFELEVLYAKLKYWAGDHMGYLDALAALLRRCKVTARAAAKTQTDPAAAAMWTERGARVCLIIASQMIEIKDFAAAAKVLEPLCLQKDGTTSPALRSAVARVYLQGGDLVMAAQHFAAVADDPMADPTQKAINAALFASAEGDWPSATTELRRVLADDPENFVAVNNLAVALLNQGRLREGIEVLESALRTSPATIVMAEPFLFNLSTMYELRSTAGADKKRDLLVEVAKWAGDGLRTTCLKMPTN